MTIMVRINKLYTIRRNFTSWKTTRSFSENDRNSEDWGDFSKMLKKLMPSQREREFLIFGNSLKN